ncbi:dehydrogenase [Actinacidiphila oryziradicis]|uniref:Dehydrogenase n=1 Tax=Actinacidiphila oryziradicis TaxID=2571141 RepID=A0A4U0S6J6_9ACTN|nr:dehydrogenase [Actinacidiphila oryziradicis]TKA04734.1 dehydrogenase [Actinacidiphila oryziradicis]
MSTEPVPECPVCGTALTSGGLVLGRREDDRKRTCRSLWRCAASHLWWQWADRPWEALESCPYPDLFAR